MKLERLVGPINSVERDKINRNSDKIEGASLSVIRATEEANAQAAHAKNMGDYADAQGDYAKAQGDYAKSIGEWGAREMPVMVAQAAYAKAQGDYAKSIGDTNKNIPLAPVANFAAIATAYKTPVVGNKVQTIDDGKFYRWNGTTWAYVEILANNAISDIQAQLSETARESKTVGHGLSVISGGPSPVDVEIQGRTLVPMQNNVLDPNKYYVLAGKMYKVKNSSPTIMGVSKFSGFSELPNIIRTANFETKINEKENNPHYAGSSSDPNVTPSSQIMNFVYNDASWNSYHLISSINNQSLTSTSKVGDVASHIFSFNIIKEIEEYMGSIPASTLEGKITWVKRNLNNIWFKWYGYGTSSVGNIATIKVWSKEANDWRTPNEHTSATVSYIDLSLNVSELSSFLNNDGICHFIAYTGVASNTIDSKLSTEYVEMDIVLKPDAILQNPKVPLYEVTQEEYNKILVDWNADEVVRRYPRVEGVTHLKNPYIIMEGENLLPPFSEMTVYNNVFEVLSPYEAQISTTIANTLGAVCKIPVLEDTYYRLSFESSTDGSVVGVSYWGANGTTLAGQGTPGSGWNTALNPSGVFKTPVGCVTIDLSFRNYGTTSGVFIFKNPMLTLGSEPKPFVPRNPSKLYFPEVVLGQIGNIKDHIYQKDGRWYLVERIVKNQRIGGLGVTSGNFITTNTTIPQEGSRSVWIMGAITDVVNSAKGLVIDNLKRSVKIANTVLEVDSFRIGANNNFLYVNLQNTLTGWNSSTNLDIKGLAVAYFNGWKYTGNNTVHSWVSIVDGTVPSQNTLEYVSTNVANGFEQYVVNFVSSFPKVTDITDKVEGSLALSGGHQIEVSSGIVVKERANPVQRPSDLFWCINFDDNNTVSVPKGSQLKYRVDKILAVYKDNKLDSGWASANTHAFGNERLVMITERFDQTAEYTVTYLVTDRQSHTVNATDVKLMYANNIRSALEDTVVKQSDMANALSVHERAIVDLYIKYKSLGGS